MKLAFLYGAFSVGARPIDFTALETSPRGLTGSELSCFEYAAAMRELGHDVTLIIPGAPDGGVWRGVELASHLPAGGWDAAYSWNEPDLLRDVRAKIRAVNQQLNDFEYCKPGFDEHVDLYTSPSATHRDYLLGEYPSLAPEKWAVVPNGCDPAAYRGAKVPGRVLYASSPDRGLHRLLEVWPEVKRRVPRAHLRVLYEVDRWIDNLADNDFPDPGIRECAYRARYIELALARMKRLGVTAVGCVSRRDIAREMAEAEVLAYPCDTVRFTEGFSVTTLEACAAGAVPVVTRIDALGELYGSLLSAVEGLETFPETVVRALTDADFAQRARTAGRTIAARHDWRRLAARLENVLRERLP